ncbi:hypothetical protein K144313037_p20090 (plasmid) [Clostridium tetani]|uniref:Conserved protein n=1 Tax=Clostridium tetani (strain Massachusetts / E88) TaxID=212717 RepID=Q896A7_CLOTE|nr:hypothetical protein [Clostridium tetani]YP_009277258.1 hypothetical protein phiCTC2A_51 [Clostridium phage phiCTC2A]YP_009277325.1 hypothetical protein phiCT19406A_51 [Clostridium phage phiCT19406A]AAO35683.1 conserved protein [Clostridium tetani E88]AJA42741.1 hypothetical protein phiCT19406A_51 [Clostridium phage phiCT19406A]AJA42937.1 hypothetical protein phiCTC2A_51 [Clostridium phage phiCTC2A]KGI38428.1 hypothetical protein KY52_08060 [Clostridium tetani]KGI42876.1 hypothetical prot
MKQNDFRKPVVYILDQELRRRDLKNKIKFEGGEEYKGELPEYPVRLVRDTNKKVIKCIYAENTELEWSEELIRNTEGKVYKIKTIYPNKSEKAIELFKNPDNRVELIDYV